MNDRTHSRGGNRTPKDSPRVVIGKAIDLFISAMAILMTGSALVKFFKRRRQAESPDRAIPRTGLETEERNQQRSKHQTSEINLRGVTWTAIGLMFSVIAVCATVGALFSLFQHHYASESPPSGVIAASRIPPAPRLENNPTSDWRQLLESEDAKLNSYGWIDKSAGVIRIPIDRAMDLVAQRGLPARGDDHESAGKTPLQMRQEKRVEAEP